MKAYPPPPSARRTFPHALVEATKAHLSVLDPTGARTRLFARNNKDAPQPGDILLATFKTGDPFSGVCLSIRRRGTDTAVLLRNRLLMTGVEMWVKIYSPTVRSIEVVQRAEKRARRARLYHMRKPKHDRGSVERVVEVYLQQRRLLRGGELKEAPGDAKGSGRSGQGKRSGQKGGRR